MSDTNINNPEYQAQTVNRSDIAAPLTNALEAEGHLLVRPVTTQKVSDEPAKTPPPPWA